MRELKFMVWDVKLDQFIDLCHTNIIGENKIGSNLGSNVVEQFTGLKDRNGIEIYEGDIIVDDESEYESCCFATVEYDETQGKFIMADWRGAYTGDIDEWACCPVVGNIHQNKELLA